MCRPDHRPPRYLQPAISFAVTLKGGPCAVGLMPVKLEDQAGVSPETVGFVSAAAKSQDDIGLWHRQLGPSRESEEAVLKRAPALARRQPGQMFKGDPYQARPASPGVAGKELSEWWSIR
jgi:hypothetical protein